jgi:hypothetical protein
MSESPIICETMIALVGKGELACRKYATTSMPADAHVLRRPRESNVISMRNGSNQSRLHTRNMFSDYSEMGILPLELARQQYPPFLFLPSRREM